MKNNVIYGAAGLGLGLIIGFYAANSLNQAGAATLPAGSPSVSSNMPSGHPEVPGLAPSSTDGPQPQIQETIDRAKQSPNDFDAQIKAAEVYYKIERFDEAIQYLSVANKLKPDDRDLIIQLGNAHFDAEKYADAGKWYEKALATKVDDVRVRTDYGLTYILRDKPDYDRGIKEFERSLAIDPRHIPTLQNLTLTYARKGDAVKANEALSKLAAVDPNNAALGQLKEEIAKIAVK